MTAGQIGETRLDGTNSLFSRKDGTAINVLYGQSRPIWGRAIVLFGRITINSMTCGHGNNLQPLVERRSCVSLSVVVVGSCPGGKFDVGSCPGGVKNKGPKKKYRDNNIPVSYRAMWDPSKLLLICVIPQSYFSIINSMRDPPFEYEMSGLLWMRAFRGARRGARLFYLLLLYYLKRKRNFKSYILPDFVIFLGSRLFFVTGTNTVLIMVSSPINITTRAYCNRLLQY